MYVTVFTLHHAPPNTTNCYHRFANGQNTMRSINPCSDYQFQAILACNMVNNSLQTLELWLCGLAIVFSSCSIGTSLSSMLRTTGARIIHNATIGCPRSS